MDAFPSPGILRSRDSSLWSLPAVASHGARRTEGASSVFDHVAQSSRQCMCVEYFLPASRWGGDRKGCTEESDTTFH